MLLKKIRLRNFRGFVDQQLELRPLTVLLGPNSSGKSSFGHSLAALAHAHAATAGATKWLRLRPTKADDESWPVDLGPFTTLRTQGREGPVGIGLWTTEGWVDLGFEGLADRSDSRPRDLSLSGYELIDPVQTTASAGGIPWGGQGRGPEGTSSTTVAAMTHLPPTDATLAIQRTNDVQWYRKRGDGGSEEVRPTFEGARLLNLQHLTGTEVGFDSLAPARVDEILRSVAYLGPARNSPRRLYEATEPGSPHRVGYRGESVPDRLSFPGELVPLLKLPEVPADLEAARAALNADPAIPIHSVPMIDAVRYWMERLKLVGALEAESLAEHAFQRIRIDAGVPGDSKVRPLTDVGFGLSQVLPVLTGGLALKMDELFIVDSPEAHLHPGPQAELGDFFCSMVKAGRNLLIETHSEMLFHRLRLRAALDPDLAAKIGVYFLRPPGPDGRCPEPIWISIPEGPWDWPKNFFQEGWEGEAAVQRVIEAKNHRGG